MLQGHNSFHFIGGKMSIFLISLLEIMKLIRTRRELSTRDKLNIVWASYGSLTKFRNVV